MSIYPPRGWTFDQIQSDIRDQKGEYAMTDELWKWTATDLAAAIKEKKITSLDVDSYLMDGVITRREYLRIKEKIEDNARAKIKGELIDGKNY